MAVPTSKMAKPFESQKDEITTMKRVDNMLAGVVKPDYIMPVKGAQGINVMAGYYEHGKKIPLEEKFAYAPLITGSEDGPELNLNLEDKDVEVMKDKANVAMLRDFDDWVIRQLGASGLTAEEKRQWLKQIYPQFLERMEAACHFMIEQEHKYKKMQLTNPQNLSDMIWMYYFEKYSQIEKGSFDFRNIINGLYGHPRTRANLLAQRARVAYERGLFNSKKRFLDYMNEWTINSGWGGDATRVFNAPSLGNGGVDDAMGVDWSRKRRKWNQPMESYYPGWGYQNEPAQDLDFDERPLYRAGANYFEPDPADPNGGARAAAAFHLSRNAAND